MMTNEERALKLDEVKELQAQYEAAKAELDADIASSSEFNDGFVLKSASGKYTYTIGVKSDLLQDECVKLVYTNRKVIVENGYDINSILKTSVDAKQFRELFKKNILVGTLPVKRSNPFASIKSVKE